MRKFKHKKTGAIANKNREGYDVFRKNIATFCFMYSEFIEDSQDWKEITGEIPLFTTDNGVEIFENDDVYWVRITVPSLPSTDHYLKIGKFDWNLIAKRNTTDYKWFSTKEKAEEFVNNQKIYSKNDILKALNDSVYLVKDISLAPNEALESINIFIFKKILDL